MQEISIFWFRRDLRLSDNAGLYHALKESPVPVLPLFIFDTEILSRLEDKDDARVTFIHDTLMQLQTRLQKLDSGLLLRHGSPTEVWDQLCDQYMIRSVYVNRDYEPAALKRDQQVRHLLTEKEITWHSSKDHVIFESDEILKQDGTPYIVFTPYKRRWLERLHSRPEKGDVSFYFKPYPVEKYAHNFATVSVPGPPSLADMGFERSALEIPADQVPQSIIRKYDQQRDFPGIQGTSRLGIHFRFGTISIRAKARRALELNATFLSELIWRDFYSQILSHYPHVVEGSFRARYDRIAWRNDEQEFASWCEGMTGYPMVDAGMRELNATGYMHNRVRMVVASFLTKHLLIDWRWGEAYFARRLLDFDLASNNGGWQWAAGCGTDAAPYFRIFNPASQLKKFDGNGIYVRKWIPELESLTYPKPIVDHKFARKRCLRVYKEALG